LTTWAKAGETDRPFIVSPNNTLGTGLSDALQTIRGNALPCAFAIPLQDASFVDYGKVNLRVTSSSGAQELTYVGKRENCGSSNDWYYDTDPASGKRLNRLITCPQACSHLRGATKAELEVTFGCIVVP
jgi:hypothetical protein